MDLHLKGLNVVVTGGSAGIGAAIVQEFINEGCNVAFFSRSQANIDAMLMRLENKHNVNVIAKAFDATDTAAFSAWLKELGKVDIFIPNVSAISLDWELEIAVDLNATIKLVDAVTPYLERSSHAAITYIGSAASSFATPGMMAYGAIKAALTHYMKSLSKILIAKNIRVNTVSPGHTLVEDGFWDKKKAGHPDAYKSALDESPTGRFGTGVEMAKVVVFLSSPAASFVSGANWIADGNLTNHIQC